MLWSEELLDADSIVWLVHCLIVIQATIVVLLVDLERVHRRPRQLVDFWLLEEVEAELVLVVWRYWQLLRVTSS